jgi:hypothetical protein
MSIDVNSLLSNTYVQIGLGVVGFILLVSLASRCTEPERDSVVITAPANTGEVLPTVSEEVATTEDGELEVLVEAEANAEH